MDSVEVEVHTGPVPSVVDLTGKAAGFIAGRRDGLLSVFVPHATAGLAIIEVGAGSEEDLLVAIDRLLPVQEGMWSHRHGSPGHGRDHVLPGFVSPSVTIPVVAGQMALGTWQALVLVDPNSDNPDRRVRFSFLPA